MLSNVIAALYGEGDSRAMSRVSRPAQVLSSLRRHFESDETLTWDQVVECLQKNNFAQEAIALSDKAVQDHGDYLVREHRVITLACESYPQILKTNLGVNAPPVFWIGNSMLRVRPPWNNPDGSQRVCIGGVGCRTPLGIGLAVAKKVGEWTAKRGYLAVSGGASGCDEGFGEGAIKAGGQVVHILPHGLNRLQKSLPGYVISVCPPDEAFSTARAMERNHLIYSFGHTTVVASARYRTGGSWQGAVAAIKANRPVVVADWTSTGFAAKNPELASGTYGLAQKALMNLGAFPLFLDLSVFRSQVDEKMDEALDWSINKLAGQIDTGLFAS